MPPSLTFYFLLLISTSFMKLSPRGSSIPRQQGDLYGVWQQQEVTCCLGIDQEEKAERARLEREKRKLSKQKSKDRQRTEKEREKAEREAREAKEKEEAERAALASKERDELERCTS